MNTPPKTVAKLILIRGIGQLLTMSGVAAKRGRHILHSDLGLVVDAALLLADDFVVAAGSEAEILMVAASAKKSGFILVGETRVDCRSVEVEEFHLGGRHVMPAFVEAHTHLCFAGSRADEFELRNRGVSYQEIAARGGGILSTVKATRAASEAELQEVARVRLAEFARQGVTTVESKSGYGLTLDAEVKTLRAMKNLDDWPARRGPRIVSTFLGAHAIPPEMKSADEYLQHLQSSVLPVVAQEGLASRVDVFIEKNYFSDVSSRGYLQAAKDLGFELTIHADQLSRSGGTELAIQLGARSADHLICINAEDISRLAASEVTCGLLPGADLYLRCDYPPARKLLDAGARVFLATDFNPGTCPTQDLSLIGLLARLEMQMTLPEVLAAYTWCAAESLGFGGRLGSLQAGWLADFVVLEQEWNQLFYACGRHQIHSVWRQGRQISH